MLSMLKLLTTVAVLSSALYANAIDDKVLAFEKKRVSANPRVEIEEVSLFLKKETSVKGWNGYVFNIKAKVQGKSINAKDIVFSDGNAIAPELLDIKTGMSLKSQMVPNITKKYYDEKHLIAGTHNAKNKIVVFSDPLCPFCLDLMPDMIKHVNKYPTNTAIYYYHFPLLRIHPAAGPLSKIMVIAEQKGVKDVTLKTYEGDFEKYFSVNEADTQKILDAANKVLGTNITLEEVNKISLEKDIKMGEDMMVQGTPTVYVNGKLDNTRIKYESLK